MRLLVLVAGVLGILGGPAWADDLAVTLPAGWVKASDGRLGFTNANDGDPIDVTLHWIDDVTCDEQPTTNVTTAPSSLPANWSRDMDTTATVWRVCTELDGHAALVIDVSNDAMTGAKFDIATVAIAAIELAARHSLHQYRADEPMPVDALGLTITIGGAGDATWWSSALIDDAGVGDQGVSKIWRASPFDGTSVEAGVKHDEVCNARRDVWLQDDGVMMEEDGVYGAFGAAVADHDNADSFCADAAGVEYILLWGDREPDHTSREEITRAIAAALPVTATSQDDGTGYYTGAYDGDATTPPPEAPTPAYTGPRSSQTQVDLRAGVAFLTPAVGDAVTGFALGAAMPTRFVKKHLAIEAGAMLMHGATVGTTFEAHLGGGVGLQRGHLALAWTAGIGGSSFGHLDDGGSQTGGGRHLYTGPFVRLEHGTLAVAGEAAIELAEHHKQSRVRVELTSSRWSHKLGVSVERMQAIDGSAISASLIVGVY